MFDNKFFKNKTKSDMAIFYVKLGIVLTAFIVSLVIVLSQRTEKVMAEGDLDWTAEQYRDYIGSNVVVADGKIKSINVMNSIDLVVLSNLKDASIYEDASIRLALQGDLDLTDDPLNPTRIDGVAYSFAGLGSEDAPFKGKLEYNTGAHVYGVILDTNLFDYLYDSSVWGSVNGLTLKPGPAMNGDVVFADKVVHDENSTGTSWKLALQRRTNGTVEDAIGGIIGTMCEDSILSLDMVNYSSIIIDSNSNAGYFCNEMLSGAELTIASFSNDESSDVLELNNSITAGTGYSAGALVGKMEKNSSFNINADINISAEIKAPSGNAGGLVGSGNDIKLHIGDGNSVLVKGVMNGGLSAGGAFGSYEYSGTSDVLDSIDVSKITVSNAQLTGGGKAGGLIGMLKNTSTDGCFTINGSGNTLLSILSGNVNAYGGIIGSYEATNLKASLLIGGEEESLLNVTAGKRDKTVNAIGVVIGEIAGSPSYVKVSNVSATYDTTSVGDQAVYSGGIVGYMDSTGSMLDICGKVKVNNTYRASTAAGAIVGGIENGVIRLSGTTDISAAKANATTGAYGQIAGYRNNALIYAVGSGNDADWTLIRNTSVTVSDIGNYGEVVRADGSKLVEEQVSDGTVSTDALITFDTVNHTVTLKTINSSDISIANETDFASLALGIMLNANGEGYGALKFDDLAVAANVLLASDIFIDNNIDLSGTGITGLMRDNGMLEGSVIATGFSGTINGNGATIKLAVGEAYGKTSGGSAVTVDNSGSGRIYNHLYNGLIAIANGSEINDLTITGNIYVGAINTAGYNLGGFIAYASGENELNNSVSSVSINYNGATSVSAGGFIGYADFGCNISFDGCTFNGEIIDKSSSTDCYDGGFIAMLNSPESTSSSSGLNEISIVDCAASGTITSSKSSQNYARVGGLIAYMRPASSAKHVNKINIDGLAVDGVQITTADKIASGGLLGYRWSNLELVMSGVTVRNSNLSTNKRFGGLVYEASGFWRVGTDEDGCGISFEAGNTISGTSVKGEVSGLIVARADGFDDTNGNNYDALYLEIGENAYEIKEGAVSLPNFSYFDEIAGQSIGENGNGVISITVRDASDKFKIDTSDCNTYTNQIAGQSYKNGETRYYYNLDSFRQADSSLKGSLELQTVDSGEKLLLWSVYLYAQDNIKSYFATTASNSVEITGEIDLTGLSYYPISVEAGSIIFNNAIVTFDNGMIQMAETAADNKKTSDNEKQHYMMQFGIFEDFVSTEKSSSSIVISGDDGLTLRGNVGYNETYSGAIICGMAEGSRDESGLTNNYFNITVSEGSKICLDGIRLYNYSAENVHANATYAPLLINKIDNYSSLTLTNVYTTEEYNDGVTTPKCASSLIGRVGNAVNGENISLTFADMGLDARTVESSKSEMYGTYNSIFSHATLLESFEYADASTCFGQYTFNAGDDYITYGKEISNTEGGVVSGRNNGKQYQYFDRTGYVRDVENGMEVITEDNASTAFVYGYLRYVCKQENIDKSAYELDINQLAYDFISGCGTYGDPYIIGNGGQLESLAAYLAGAPLPGWQLQVDLEALNAQNSSGSVHTSDEAYGNHAIFAMSGSGEWAFVSGSADYTNEDVVLSSAMTTYLRNAYYLIENDITVGSNGTFAGIGSSNVKASGTGSEGQSRSFSGVIIGKMDGEGNYPTVRIYAPNTVVNQYGGLVKFANGCVVKDLNIVYEEAVTIESVAVPADKTPANQVFFGGVIGYALGGDNIIDNVTVANIDNKVLVTGDYDFMANIGGYVGLVGGNVTEGGGVVFKNMTDDNKLSSVKDNNSEAIDLLEDIEIDVKKDGSNVVSDEGNTHLYWNPYVGRVLDGFVCYDGANSKVNKETKLSNTDKNYTIPTLVSESKLDANDNNINIESRQQLWILSAIVNSGAGTMKPTGKYDEGAYAYYWGKVRNGNYDYVGENYITNDSDISIDEHYWGGTSDSAVDKTCYLIEKFSKGLVESDETSKTIEFSEAGNELYNWKNAVSDIYTGAQKLYSTGSNKTAYSSIEIKTTNGKDVLQVVKDENNYLDKYNVKYYISRYSDFSNSEILASGEITYEPLTIDYSEYYSTNYDGTTSSLRLFICIDEKNNANMNNDPNKNKIVIRNGAYPTFNSNTGNLELDSRQNRINIAGTGSYTAYRPFALKDFSASDVLTIKESKDDVFFMVSNNATYTSGQYYAVNGKYITSLENGEAEFNIASFMSENGLSSKDNLYLLVFVRNSSYGMTFLQRSLEMDLEILKNGVSYYSFEELVDFSSFLFSNTVYTVSSGKITDVKQVTSAGNDKRYSYVIPLTDSIKSIDVVNTFPDPNKPDQKGQLAYYVTDSYPKVGTVVYESQTTAAVYSFTDKFNEDFIESNKGRYLIIMVGNGSSSFGDLGISLRGLKITINYNDKAVGEYQLSKVVGTYNALNINADCDMTKFGNGFRGIGSSYQDNAVADVLKRSIPLIKIAGNSHYIKLNRNVYEYSDDASCWWTQGVGLFPVVYFPTTANISDLTLKGAVEIKYKDNTTDTLTGYIGEASAGGFSGMTANGSGFGTVIFKDVKLEDLTVTGAKYDGGYIGVVGRPSRTTIKALEIVSTNASTYIFNDCGYENITVEGFYTAGGFIGTWNNDKILYINGMTNMTNSRIGWLKDACLEMYTVRPNANKNDSKVNGYSGAGGIVGFSSKDIYINYSNATVKYDKNTNKLNIDGIHMYSPQEAYNCDYGLGTIAGLVNGGSNVCVYNVEAVNSKVEVILDKDYVSQFKKYSEENPYFTPSIGTLFGYAKTQITMDLVKLENDFVLNGGYAGGVIGNANKKATITNLDMNKVVVYSKGAYTYNGSDLCGGIVGSHSASAEFLLDMAEISNLIICNDGRAAGILANSKNTTKNVYKNLRFEDCVITTVGEPTGMYFKTTDSDPGLEKDTKVLADKRVKTELTFAAETGILVGSATDYNDAINNQVNIVYNMLTENPLVGYCLEGSKYGYDYVNKVPTYNGNALVSFEDYKACYNSDTVGVYTGEKTGVAYSKYVFSENNKDEYTKGQFGSLVGKIWANNTLEVVGWTNIGGYLPYEISGDNNIGFNDKTENYIIFADYEGASSVNNADRNETVGTIDFDSFVKTDAKAPFAVINPLSNIVVYDGMSALQFTGDGMSSLAATSIINDTADPNGESHTLTKPYNLIYYKNGNVNASLQGIAKLYAAGGQKEDYLTPFSVAREVEGELSDIDDFDVLLLQTINSQEITETVNEYISLMTGCDQTGSGALAPRYVKIVPYTFTKNADTGKYEKNEVSTISVKGAGANTTLSVTTGKYDNTLDQFTVLDVIYQNPYGSQEYYHLYVPMVIKKILNFDFYASILSGTNYYPYVYEELSNQVVANYGDNLTAYLEFGYYRSAEEWQASIDAGESLLWNYDKKINIGRIKLPEGTRITLVDKNKGGLAYAVTVDASMFTEKDEGSYILDFDKVFSDASNAVGTDEGWSCSYFSELLDLSIEETGAFEVSIENTEARKKLTAFILLDSSAGKPEDATVFWDGKYYRLATELEKASITGEGDEAVYTNKLYSIKTMLENNTVDDGVDVVKLIESYYMTIQVPADNTSREVINNAITFEPQLLSFDKEKVSGIPTKKKNPIVGSTTIYAHNNNENKYIICDFFETELEVETSNGDELMSEANREIYVEVSDKLNFSSATAMYYSDNIELWQGYQLRYAEYDYDSNSSFTVIKAGTIVDYDFTVTDIDGNVITYNGNKLEKVYANSISVSSDVNGISIKYPDNLIEVLKNASSGNPDDTVSGGIIVKTNVILKYESDALEDQFPTRISTQDRSGISVTGQSKVAFSEEALGHPSIKSNKTDVNNRFYVEESSLANLKYYAYKINTGDNTGNESQMGINPNDPINNADVIYTEGVYDTNLVLEPGDYIRCVIQLQHKTDNSDGTAVYGNSLELDKYLENITINGFEASDSGKDVLYSLSSDKKSLTVIMPSDLIKQKDKVFYIPVDFSVLTGNENEGADPSEFEANNQIYANYKVTLSVSMLKDNVINATAIDGSTCSDYIIYTNARVRTDIIDMTLYN